MHVDVAAPTNPEASGSPRVLDLRGQLPHEQESHLVAAFDALPVGESVVVVSDGLLGLLHLRLDEIRPRELAWARLPTAVTCDTGAQVTRIRRPA